MNKERIINNKLIYVFAILLIAIMMIASVSYSRYLTTTSANGKVGLAKFAVKVNDVDVTTDERFTLELGDNLTTNSLEGKMVPGSQGTFMIEINPAGSEVALEYEFSFDTTKLPTGVKITDVDAEGSNGNQVTQPTLEDNKVKGVIELPKDGSALTTENTIHVEIGWKWEDVPIEVPESGLTDSSDVPGTKIDVTGIVRQRIRTEA